MERTGDPAVAIEVVFGLQAGGLLQKVRRDSGKEGIR
jgi:hypothetical protein